MGLVRSGADLSAPVTWIAALVAIGLPATGAAVLLSGPFRERGRRRDRTARLARETQEADVLALAREHGGRLTLAEAMADLALSEPTARGILSDLTTRGMCDLQVTESGLLVYVFDDLALLDEKPDSRGVLDV
ncbi:MAG: hypothetical protein GWN71_19845 [Gammaproteobacteria bacterium]|nr:hypothetical protein [Gemmatimonadota bacterium]NIU75736.1 hypothetical protein [Gammaproteobacteria bacterium]NIY09681.1 hypothetical protein [Gemmatimonadota bacterium]